MFGEPVRDLFFAWSDRFGAQASGEVACVDVDGTGRRTQSVHGAGFYSGVGKIIGKGIGIGYGRAGEAHVGKFPLNDDTLPGSQSQPEAGTLRLAKSTFDTFIDFGRNKRHGFKISGV